MRNSGAMALAGRTSSLIKARYLLSSSARSPLGVRHLKTRHGLVNTSCARAQAPSTGGRKLGVFSFAAPPH